MNNLVGQCWNCETKGPLGLFCSQCVDTGFIYETIPNASSSNSDGSLTNSLSVGITNSDKGIQVNGQLSFKEILMQLYNLVKSYFTPLHSDLPSANTCSTFINLESIGDLRQSKHFDNVRLWMTALPFQKFTIQDTDVEGHWDGGSNSHLFTKKEYFYVMQPITSQVTQVSGEKAVCEGIGIVIIHIPKTDIIIPLYPAYYAPEFPQNTVSPTAIKHYNKYRSVRSEALD